jgi:hypothetical protein
MNRRTGLTCLLALTVLSAGCGSVAGQASSPASPVQPLSLATSLDTAAGTWAVAVMGGSAASHNNFWQLFVRPAATGTWRLATPPGVASNGGLVVASSGSGPVVAGFRPSQDLSYSPLATTHDNGTAWTPAILDAGLADVPDALAVAPAGGRLLAMLTNGNAEISGPNRTAWTRLASRRALAATAAGRRCGLRSLTAAGYTPSGLPLLAGTCSRPGTAGIFAASNRTWQAAGPLMPAALARQQITVLRLASSANDIVALLAAGSGHATRLLAAWSAGGSGRWSLSPPLQPGGAALASASFGPGGTVAVVTTGNRGAVITGADGHWRALPALPPGTVTLAPGTGSQIEALAVHRATLTVWQLPSGGRRWAPRQVISVPIQFGSSG